MSNILIFKCQYETLYQKVKIQQAMNLEGSSVALTVVLERREGEGPTIDLLRTLKTVPFKLIK